MNEWKQMTFLCLLNSTNIEISQMCSSEQEIESEVNPFSFSFFSIA